MHNLYSCAASRALLPMGFLFLFFDWHDTALTSVGICFMLSLSLRCTYWCLNSWRCCCGLRWKAEDCVWQWCCSTVWFAGARDGPRWSHLLPISRPSSAAGYF